MKYRKLRIIGAVVAIALCVSFLRTLITVQYDMVRTSYGGRRMTRAEAEELAAKNYRWYQYLLSKVPDREFLPEVQSATPHH